MFSQASIMLSMGGFSPCILSLPVWLPGPMFLPEGISACSHVPFEWGSLSKGGLCLGVSVLGSMFGYSPS